MRIYLDWNAAAPLRPAARAAMLDALAPSGNPSSPHAEGRSARDAVESARASVAQLAGTAARELSFTASATEALNQALCGLARSRPGRRRIVVGATEHAAVLEPARALAREGFTLVELAVDGSGRHDLAALERALGEPTAVVALAHVNNETGVVSDLAAASLLAHAAGATLLVDAAQSAGKLPIALERLGADALALSSAKLGGPLGAGALVTRPGLALEPLIRGGPHERGRRAGSEAVPAIAGMGAAAAEAHASLASSSARVAGLRSRFERELMGLGRAATIHGLGAERAPGTVSVAFPGADAEALVVQLDLMGVACSTGSACASGAAEPSHVLLAMGVDRAMARSTLRFSFGETTAEGELDAALERLALALERQARAGVAVPAMPPRRGAEVGRP